MEAACSLERLPGIGLLEQTPMILEKLLLAVPPEMLEWKPSTERWSVSEVLGHLAETEETFRERTRRMIEEDLPFLESYDQNASHAAGDRKSTRLNSSHVAISYAVFCLKKKNK